MFARRPLNLVQGLHFKNSSDGVNPVILSEKCFCTGTNNLLVDISVTAFHHLSSHSQYASLVLDWIMCSAAPFDNGWYGGTSVCLTQFCLRKCVNSYEMNWGHCLKQLLWPIHMLQTKVSFGQYCSEQSLTSCAPPQPTWNGCQSLKGSSCHSSEQNRCVLFATPE